MNEREKIIREIYNDFLLPKRRKHFFLSFKSKEIPIWQIKDYFKKKLKQCKQ